MLFFCLVPAKESAVPDKEALLEEYMAQIAKGDHDALAALYQHTNASIYGFALSILKNASDAEDALHDCFLDVYKRQGQHCRRAIKLRFRTWTLRHRGFCRMRAY